MFYGGMVNVPGAPGNLVAGGPSFDINRSAGPLGGRFNEELMKRGIMPGAGPQLPMAFGSSNLPAAVGNMAGLANATFFEGPQLGQATPQGVPSQPYGGSPNRQLTEEEKAKLLQQGTPPPPNFREQFFPKAELVPGFQGKYVS
jgi:hypothetical protein